MNRILKPISNLNLNQLSLLAFAVILSLSLYLSWANPISRSIRKGERINALLIGTDIVDYARHSDTLIFASYDPVRRFLDIISIPRDTRFSPKGYNFKKINEVYAYHYRTKQNDAFAAIEVCKAVEELFQNRLEIPYYVTINYSSFKKFIDLIGGIKVDIEEPMNYDDQAGNLHIHFNAGVNHLDGAKALEYVRFRGKAGDLGRIFRQQLFVKSFLLRWKNPYFIFNLPKIAKLLMTEIFTNINTWDAFSGIIEVKDINMKNIRFSQLPGQPNKKGYWEYDTDNLNGLLNKILPNRDLNPSKSPNIRVEIWNATGTGKMAEQVTWILRKSGFDVIDWGNFTTRQKKTLIKDLTGDLRGAQRISEILNCGEVITRYDEKRLIDISVILGEDCKINTK
ncbi:MAG: LCP family protein [Elusimicrobia bacterium]|nr:LCP family protein [Candidatus Liberimonas magnetica]